MPLDPVDLLLDRLTEDAGAFPPKLEAPIHSDVRTWRAFLDGDRELLALAASWPADRQYRVDPLPDLIASAWASHLFGDDLAVTPETDADSGPLDLLLESNGDLTGELHEAERQVVAEGEAWWRVYADSDVADAPMLEWHSRESVLPLFIGRRLVACALVTELGRHGRSRGKVYRHLEVHAPGVVEHVLFQGTPARIGSTVPLESHPELLELGAGLTGTPGTLEARRWDHGLPMLMGRITNGRGSARRRGDVGRSDFARVSDFLLDLNEAASIAAENARLTGKKRAIVPEESLQRRRPELVDNGAGQLVPKGAGLGWDAGEDLLVVSKLDAELGTGADAPFRVLEYSFDAEALITYKRDLVETALTRVGITPQAVGVQAGADGYAISGTALRLRLLPQTKAGNGKLRPWHDQLPSILSLMARLDALPVEAGGFGRRWSSPDLPPAIEWPNPLPHDDVEEAQVEAALVQAGVRSVRTSVAAQHPEWSDEQVDEEVARIAAERPASSAAFTPGLA